MSFSFSCSCSCSSSSSLHLHEIMEGLYFHCSSSVCLSMCLSMSLSVCLSMCSTLLVNNIPAERCIDLGAVFAKRLLMLAHWFGPYWNWWPWVKGQGHSGSISIFLHNFLLISLLYISAFVCLIKLKFCMSIWHALCRFVIEYHKNQKGMTSKWRHLSFLHRNVHISNSIEPTNFFFWYEHSTTLDAFNV